MVQTSSFNLNPLAIDAEELRKPHLPMAVFHQEASDLLAFLDQDDAWRKLIDVGHPEDAQSAAETALTASRAAQSAWVTATRPRKTQDDEARELLVRRQYAKAMSACRFNLRDDRSAQEALERLKEKRGLAALAADCAAMAKLLEANLEAFANDKSFDAPAMAAQLSEVATAMTAVSSERRAARGPSPLAEARDRAFHVLYEILEKVRTAGRHAFRNTPDARRFGSEYLRQKVRRSREERQPA